MSDSADLKRSLLERIDNSERSKISLKIKSLMTEFGFTAIQRVRQSSLAEVTRMLDDWGIGHKFPNGTAANDFITLSRSDAFSERRVAKASEASTVAKCTSRARHAKAIGLDAPVVDATYLSGLSISPWRVSAVGKYEVASFAASWREDRSASFSQPPRPTAKQETTP